MPALKPRPEQKPSVANRVAGWLGLNTQAPRNSKLGYDAVDSKNRRQAATGRLLSEDDELPTFKRRKLMSGTRDLQRNFTIAAWAIRKHLDFVASMRFHARTDDQDFNHAWEARMKWWSCKENCDASGRHSLRRMIRLSESMKTVLGDHFLIKMADRTVFALEGDRVHNPLGMPEGVDRSRMIQGVQVDRRGRPVAYAVHNRKLGGVLEFDRMIPAESVMHHASYDRFDQTRGVSPIAAALNQFRDIYEGADYALAKAKVAQMFGLVLFRDAVKAAATLDETDADGEESEGDDDTDSQKNYSIDFGKGPVLLDLDPGDRAEFLENRTPSTEFREFMQVMISIALKSLDIPFSFYDEAYTNFFGSRTALTLYLKSCDSKQEDLRDVLRPLTLWNLTWDVADGTLVLPKGIATIEECPFEWVANGVPWWNPSQEVSADVAAVEAGFRTRTEIRKERYGDDWRENVVDVLASEEAYLLEKGVTVTRAAPTIYDQPAIVKGKDDAQN